MVYNINYEGQNFLLGIIRFYIGSFDTDAKIVENR